MSGIISVKNNYNKFEEKSSVTFRSLEIPQTKVIFKFIRLHMQTKIRNIDELK